jgi:hypothetical protein
VRLATSPTAIITFKPSKFNMKRVISIFVGCAAAVAIYIFLDAIWKDGDQDAER